ncbi:hypothetical protein DPMN_103819 [Dreissena polymorpha]|uniref:Uncharacterized protein n=1 Tax=Dreissena polymorpha TaxID=45954 RepID=A0A9D4H6N3_DREPO|nr:hypothetical protein DPMN_103819 [Dreissena polymorpha]
MEAKSYPMRLQSSVSMGRFLSDYFLPKVGEVVNELQRIVPDLDAGNLVCIPVHDAWRFQTGSEPKPQRL